METKKLIGLRIKELRKKRKLSQERLAEFAAITAAHMSNIETGKENPTIDTVSRLALALDINVADLFEFQHLSSRRELQKIIVDTAKKAHDDELRLIVKFIKTMES